MDLEQRFQTLLIEREQTLITLVELVQQIQNSLVLLAKQTEHQQGINQLKRCFQDERN